MAALISSFRVLRSVANAEVADRDREHPKAEGEDEAGLNREGDGAPIEAHPPGGGYTRQYARAAQDDFADGVDAVGQRVEVGKEIHPGRQAAQWEERPREKEDRHH